MPPPPWFHAWKEFASTTKVVGSIPMEFEIVWNYDFSYAMLECVAAVKDRDTMEPKWIRFRKELDYWPDQVVHEEEMQLVILSLVETFYRHEARECLKFNGVRVFDPHA